MPVVGYRRVCKTANYKYIEKKRKSFDEREEELAKWYKEKEQRVENLRRMSIASRNRAGSVGSIGNGSLSEAGGANVDFDGVGKSKKKSSSLRRSASTRSASSSRPGAVAATSSGEAVTKSSSVNSGLDFHSDTRQIIGGGRETETGYLCGDCGGCVIS